MTLYRFEPPTSNDGARYYDDDWQRARAGVSRVANQLARHVPAVRSVAVLKLDGAYVELDSPTTDQIDAATEVYLGGHVAIVDSATATALTTAGYTVEAIA